MPFDKSEVSWGDIDADWNASKDVEVGGIFPAGTYVAKVDQMWAGRSKTSSKPLIFVRFLILSAVGAAQRGEDPAKYKGYSCLLLLNLTHDPKTDPTAYALARKVQFEQAIGFTGDVKANATSSADFARHATGEIVRIEVTVGKDGGADRNNVDSIAPPAPEDLGGFALESGSNSTKEEEDEVPF